MDANEIDAHSRASPSYIRERIDCELYISVEGVTGGRQKLHPLFPSHGVRTG